jgi:hypothetical protein
VKLKISRMKKGYLWVTMGFFLLSLIGHWTFAWFSYVQDQKEHNNQPIEISDYFNKTFRDTLENWQSEFLQLAWQVGGLSFLWAVASPQSKSESNRLEEKIDLIIKKMEPDKADQLLKELEKQYPKK